MERHPHVAPELFKTLRAESAPVQVSTAQSLLRNARHREATPVRRHLSRCSSPDELALEEPEDLPHRPLPSVEEAAFGLLMKFDHIRSAKFQAMIDMRDTFQVARTQERQQYQAWKEDAEAEISMRRERGMHEDAQRLVHALLDPKFCLGDFVLVY